MADLGPAFGALLELVGPLAGRAVKAFVATTFGMIALGVAVAVGSSWVLFSQSFAYGLLGLACGIGIFIGLVGNWNHRAHARLASQPSE